MHHHACQVTIRPATPADAAAVAVLSGQLGYRTQPAEAEWRLRELLSRTDHAVWVALAAGEAVGWIHAHETFHLPSEFYVELGGLVVDERHRGSGVGRVLLETAEGWARARGHRILRVRSNVIRAAARVFYEGLGYSVDKVQNVFIKELDLQPGQAEYRSVHDQPETQANGTAACGGRPVGPAPPS